MPFAGSSFFFWRSSGGFFTVSKPFPAHLMQGRVLLWIVPDPLHWGQVSVAVATGTSPFPQQTGHVSRWCGSFPFAMQYGQETVLPWTSTVPFPSHVWQEERGDGILKGSNPLPLQKAHLMVRFIVYPLLLSSHQLHLPDLRPCGYCC